MFPFSDTHMLPAKVSSHVVAQNMRQRQRNCEKSPPISWAGWPPNHGAKDCELVRTPSLRWRRWSTTPAKSPEFTPSSEQRIDAQPRLLEIAIGSTINPGPNDCTLR